MAYKMEAIGKVAAALVLVAGLAACASHGQHHRGERSSSATAAAPALYSPNGEPLNGGPLGQPSCDMAMSYWFDRLAKDGRIDRGAFLADARAQFAKMDLDHLGFITSDELERYRAPYRQGTRLSLSGGGDPVMSADTDLDFKVTLDELLREAGETFDRLDADHDGAIERGELTPLCSRQPSREEEAPKGDMPSRHQRGEGP